ncbi:tumor necrosis factor receptor superfamily member 1A isoform X2 [Hippoglossus stenolepis]|uniref:tumor necrosis factor receptor superfamily member 1A isoform X2 n=2 Tax=Hippoglossus TaxID=8266 RepID=UPI00159C385F|nr:tumor necrosis factor receptor superfamily member 1A isoform X2 [Hippoglossus stenolepis]
MPKGCDTQNMVQLTQLRWNSQKSQTLHSLDMDLVLDFLLILVVLSGGQSNDNMNSCYSICPAGYFKSGGCDNRPGYYKCKLCGNMEYTEIENTIRKCHRCSSCGHSEVTISPCNITSDVKCGCKEGYYDQGTKSTRLDCRMCHCQYCKGPDTNTDKRKMCQACQRCAETPVPPPSTTTPTISPGNITQTDPVPLAKPMPWLPYLVAVGIAVVLCGLLLLLLHLIRKKTEKLNMVLCCRTNIEQGSDQGSSSTTLRFNISEETHMMDLSHCPASPRHPAAHICPLLPNVEQEAVRQDEQSEHWPAIVLYAVIKEVPLRRWKEFLRLLLVADQQLERVELEAGLGSMEKQYQMLRLWSQRSSASLSDVFSALHHMDLSGCAQLLQENLEKLQWTPQPKYGFSA